MIFCGQCGLQIASGSTRCPRCGAIIEETSKPAGELHSDDPTVATPSLQNQPSTSTQQSPTNQPPLILRPGQNSGTQGTQAPYNNYDETSMMERTNTPLSPPMGNSYPGYPAPGYPAQPSGSGYAPQSSGNYPPQGMYPADYGTSGAGGYGPGTNAGNYGPGMSYPNMSPQTMNTGYSSTNGQYQPDEHAARAARGRTTGLVLVLCGLIFILGAVVLFALHTNII
jgi:hypothetical protein